MIGKGSAALQGMLKVADHKSGGPRRQWRGRLAGCRFFMHFATISTPAPSLVSFAAAFVAAQPFFDTDRGLISALIGVGRHALSFQ